MREIKFRAWSKHDKQMFWNVQNAYDTLGKHYPESLENAPDEEKDKYTVYASSFGGILTDDDMIVMQFTGLRDKRGKDVYEGDIVIYKVCGDPEKTMEVKFIDGSFVAGPDQYNDYRTMHTEEMEVIGNIYENPSLLTPEAPTK